MPKILDPDHLTYLVDGSPTTQNLRFNTTNKTIQLVAGGSLVAKDGVTGQCLFSKIKEVIKADPNLIKFPLPVREMIHDESMELINGWTFLDTTTIKMVRDCGVAYVNASGATTAMFACFVNLGTVAAGTATADLYFVQSSATNATTSTFTHLNTADSFGVNELVQIYSDTNGDGTPDYDYRSYAKVFLRRAGYTYSESTNTRIGYPELTYKKYNFPITHVVDQGVTVDDGTLAGYTGMSITWYNTAQSFSLGTNGPYNFHLVVNANNRTYEEIYSWVQYQLRQSADIDAGAANRTGKVAPALVFMDGAILKTMYQDTNDTFEGGIHITNPAGSSLNNIAEADDTGAYRTYPYVAAITLEFDEYLVLDGADAKFWLFDATGYGTGSAALLKDNNNVDITGTISGASLSFGYNFTANKNFVGVAVGKDNAKIAVATGTIVQSTGNKAVFVAGLERWYSNPV
jgi:hypothetical protein